MHIGPLLTTVSLVEDIVGEVAREVVAAVSKRPKERVSVLS